LLLVEQPPTAQQVQPLALQEVSPPRWAQPQLAREEPPAASALP